MTSITASTLVSVMARDASLCKMPASNCDVATSGGVAHDDVLQLDRSPGASRDPIRLFNEQLRDAGADGAKSKECDVIRTHE